MEELGRGREGAGVQLGRQSEEAGVERETEVGSHHPLCGPYCAGLQSSSCCSDIRLSAGPSKAC